MKTYLNLYNFSLRASKVTVSERCWFAYFKVNNSFSSLFPYIHSTANEAVYYKSPKYISFKLDDIVCKLYPPNIVSAKIFHGREEALEFANKLINYLNYLENNKSQIKPNYKKLSHIHVTDILRFLPLTNCGKCGFKTCLAFASAISRRKTKLTMCKHFPKPVGSNIVFSVKERNSEKFRNLEIDSELYGSTIPNINHLGSLTKAKPDIKKRKRHLKKFSGKRNDISFNFSTREIEVLRLISEGFTNKEIGQILNISHNTVKSHVVHIFNKLGVNDRTHAAVWASRNGLL